MDQIQDQKQEPEIKIVLADESHVHYVDEILETIAAAAKVRGTGIAKRNPEYFCKFSRHIKPQFYKAEQTCKK